MAKTHKRRTVHKFVELANPTRGRVVLACRLLTKDAITRRVRDRIFFKWHMLFDPILRRETVRLDAIEVPLV